MFQALINLFKNTKTEEKQSHPLDGSTRVAQEKVEEFSQKVSQNSQPVQNTVKAESKPRQQQPKKPAVTTKATKSPSPKSGQSKKKK